MLKTLRISEREVMAYDNISVKEINIEMSSILNVTGIIVYWFFYFSETRLFNQIKF